MNNNEIVNLIKAKEIEIKKLQLEVDKMKELFYELINEASEGKVIIDNEVWPIGFNTIIEGKEVMKFSNNNMSTLVIKDENAFFTKLEEYLKLELEKNRKCIKFYSEVDKNHQKMLMAYLFVNATTEDFLNPINLIERQINFLSDNTFEYLNNGVSLEQKDLFLGSNLEITNRTQSVLMETPNKIEINFNTFEDNQKLFYHLPTVSYGISKNSKGEKECYIYSILKHSEKDSSESELKYHKKISRKLYKLNKDVINEESEEYLDYKSGVSDYYPENISDVSPSAVLALSIFFSLLEKEEINNVIGVPYLPLRYLSRTLAANNIEDENKKEELIERNDAIQTNITDKFIRTFRRVKYHMDEVEITSYPYDYDEFIHIVLVKNKINTNNVLLNNVVDSINNRIK